MTSHLLRLWVIGSYEMPRCDWLQHCNFLAGIEILPIALQTACKPCGFAAGRPAIVAGPVLRVAIGESCSVCRALKQRSASPVKHRPFLTTGTASLAKWLRRPTREQKIPGWNPACAGIFPGSSHTSDFKIATPVATLPGAWRYRVSVGTGRPGASIL